MLSDFKNDETGRIRALNRLEILDTDEEQPFEKIVALVQQVLEVPICAVSLVDVERQWFKARRGLDVCQTARDISFCTHAIKSTDPFIIRDALAYDLFKNNPLVTGNPNIRSYAGVPLTTPEGYNVGTLCAIDTVPRDFPAHEVAILQNFAKVVVDELELRQIAATDVLTGAMSRRAWLDRAKTEVVRARRHDRPLAIGLLDLDRFKSVNDIHGHAAGDIVIQTLAKTVFKEMRQSDLFGRFGGEEFVLMMPEATTKDAVTLAERIRRAFAAEHFSFMSDSHCTASIGIAGLRTTDTDTGTILARADKALYKAKERGRDQTCTEDSYDADQQAVA